MLPKPRISKDIPCYSFRVFPCLDRSTTAAFLWEVSQQIQHQGSLSPYWPHREQTYKSGGHKHILLQFTLEVKEPDRSPSGHVSKPFHAPSPGNWQLCPKWQTPSAKTSPTSSCGTKSHHIFCRLQSSLCSMVKGLAFSQHCFFLVAEVLPAKLLSTLHLCSRLFPAQHDAPYLAFMNPLLQITSLVHLSYIQILTSSVPADEVRIWPQWPPQTTHLLLPGLSRAQNLLCKKV